MLSNMISSHARISYLHMWGYHIVFINLLPVGIYTTVFYIINENMMYEISIHLYSSPSTSCVQSYLHIILHSSNMKFHLYLDFSTVHWAAVYSAEILWSTATTRLRGVSKLHRNWLTFTYILGRNTHRSTRHCSAQLQTVKRALTTSKHSIEFTLSYFPW